MKKYNVEVNGTDYEVIIKDEQGGEVTKDTTQNTETKATVKEEVVSQKDQTVASSTVDTGDMTTVEAPMSGTILSIKVDTGQSVEAGETIMTLEAMKMETEISAPVSGTIGAIKVGEGDNCEHGTVIALIKEAD